MFHRCTQKDNQSATQFLNTLQKLAADCDFGQSLSQNLKTRLLCGIKEGRLREAVLAGSTDLTYEQTKNLFIQKEAVREQSRIMARAELVFSAEVPVNKATYFPNSGAKRAQARFARETALPSARKQSNGAAQRSFVCWRCGAGHHPDTCKFMKAKCFKCNRICLLYTSPSPRD